MSPKFVNFEILFVYFLLLIPWPHTEVMKLFCSKDSSRLVRKIVRSKWSPILSKYQVELPFECPLHPVRDLFAPRQDAKQRDRPTQWTCRLCGKSFYEEKHLDLHFETRHKTILNEAEDAVCLGDFCDIMRCEVFQSEESASLKFPDQHIVTEIEVWSMPQPQNAALGKANAAYLSLLPLRTSSLGASRASKVQNRQLSQDRSGQSTIKDTTAEQFGNPAEKSKNPNDAKTKKGTARGTTSNAAGSSSNTKHSKQQETTKVHKNHSDELNGEDGQNNNNNTNSTNDNGNKTLSDQAGNMQKVRANCKAEDLSKLKAKCEYLVHSCISGLSLSLPDPMFKDLEEEMNKAVCWYLTCDRYWEDGPLEPRAFPWGLILILIFVLSTGICFCYYIIWILFDSEEATINANHHTYMQYPYQQYPPITGTHGLNAMQHYYYQQQQQAHDLYPEPPQYDYRHSPRRYIADQRQLGTPTATGGGQTQHSTPLHHHHPMSLAYQQDILDQRDYISRPIATSAVSSGSSMGPNTSATTVASSIGHSGGGDASSATIMDCDTNAAGASGIGGGSGAGGGAGVGGVRHYNTHPRNLQTHHRHAGASQQSLRGSSSSHEIIQNEIGHNEHYIYVTYPPDLKKRFSERYE